MAGFICIHSEFKTWNSLMRLIWGVSSRAEWYNSLALPLLTMWNEILTSQMWWQVRISLASKAMTASDHTSPSPLGKVWGSLSITPQQVRYRLWETWDTLSSLREPTLVELTSDNNGMRSRGSMGGTDARRCWEKEQCRLKEAIHRKDMK